MSQTDDQRSRSHIKGKIFKNIKKESKEKSSIGKCIQTNKNEHWGKELVP